MKRSIIVAIVLAAAVCGLMWLSMEKREEYHAKLSAYEEAYGEMEKQEQLVQEKQAQLAALTTDKADKQNADAQALQQQASQLEQEILELQAQIEALQTSLDDMSEAYQDKQEEMDYLDQVYQALQEGYEKVKGYIAGN